MNELDRVLDEEAEIIDTERLALIGEIKLLRKLILGLNKGPLPNNLNNVYLSIVLSSDYLPPTCSEEEWGENIND